MRVPYKSNKTDTPVTPPERISYFKIAGVIAGKGFWKDTQTRYVDLQQPGVKNPVRLLFYPDPEKIALADSCILNTRVLMEGDIVSSTSLIPIVRVHTITRMA